MADAAKPLVDETGTGVELTEQTQPLRTGNDAGGMDARDLIPQEEPKKEIPDAVTLRGPNGEKQEVKLTPQMFCFKGKPPPGGWYGPFGFLRMVYYVFLGVALFGVVALLVGFFTGPSLWSTFTRILLAPAAVLAAMAAYSHEGLANEVTKVAKRNDEYAAMNDQFDGQLQDLEGVAQKLDDLVSKTDMNLEKLTSVIDGLERISDLGKLEAIVRSFTDAELREFLAGGHEVTRRLSNVGELKAFLENCVSVIQHNMPSFDLRSFKMFGLRGGVGLTIISILIAAVNTENQDEQKALVDFMFFILDPHGEGRKQKTIHAVAKHLKDNPKFGNRAALVAELDRLIATVDPAAKRGRIQEDDLKPLAMAMLTTIAPGAGESSKSLNVIEDVSDDDE